jgi:hypothetical protein
MATPSATIGPRRPLRSARCGLPLAAAPGSGRGTGAIGTTWVGSSSTAGGRIGGRGRSGVAGRGRAGGAATATMAAVASSEAPLTSRGSGWPRASAAGWAWSPRTTWIAARWRVTSARGREATASATEA